MSLAEARTQQPKRPQAKAKAPASGQGKVVTFPGAAMPALLTAVPKSKVSDLLPAIMQYLIGSEVIGVRVIGSKGNELELEMRARMHFRFEDEEVK